jgi:hypothetical protein
MLSIIYYVPSANFFSLHLYPRKLLYQKHEWVFVQNFFNRRYGSLKRAQKQLLRSRQCQLVVGAWLLTVDDDHLRVRAREK